MTAVHDYTSATAYFHVELLLCFALLTIGFLIGGAQGGDWWDQTCVLLHQTTLPADRSHGGSTADHMSVYHRRHNFLYRLHYTTKHQRGRRLASVNSSMTNGFDYANNCPVNCLGHGHGCCRGKTWLVRNLVCAGRTSLGICAHYV